MTVYRMIDPATVTTAEWAEWERRDREMESQGRKAKRKSLTDAPVESKRKPTLTEQITANEAEYRSIVALLERQGIEGDFESRANRYAEERGVSLSEAYHAIASEHPDLYQAYRNAAFLNGQLPSPLIDPRPVSIVSY